MCKITTSWQWDATEWARILCDRRIYNSYAKFLDKSSRHQGVQVVRLSSDLSFCDFCLSLFGGVARRKDRFPTLDAIKDDMKRQLRTIPETKRKKVGGDFEGCFEKLKGKGSVWVPKKNTLKTIKQPLDLQDISLVINKWSDTFRTEPGLHQECQ